MVPRETHLPDQGLDATGATVDLVQRNLANDLGAVFPARVKRCELLHHRICRIGRA